MTEWKRLEFLENNNEEIHMNQPFCSMALQTAIGSFPFHFQFFTKVWTEAGWTELLHSYMCLFQLQVQLHCSWFMSKDIPLSAA
jgi:hypothetical protein